MSQEAGPRTTSRTDNHDAVHHFLMESHRIATEAQFIVDSLPNAEPAAVERVVHQLDAIRIILLSFDDPVTSLQETEHLISYVNFLLALLEAFLAAPPPPVNTRVPREHTNVAGRPRYTLDLNRAHELHQLGNTWKDIADAMRVVRQTLYNHMALDGRSTGRKEWSEILDEDLDQLVAEISVAHPFVGSAIVQGHLEAQGIHIPRLRVQESLRRVDAMGVLVRCAEPPLFNHV